MKSYENRRSKTLWICPLLLNGYDQFDHGHGPRRALDDDLLRWTTLTEHISLDIIDISSYLDQVAWWWRRSKGSWDNKNTVYSCRDSGFPNLSNSFLFWEIHFRNQTIWRNKRMYLQQAQTNPFQEGKTVINYPPVITIFISGTV